VQRDGRVTESEVCPRAAGEEPSGGRDEHMDLNGLPFPAVSVGAGVDRVRSGFDRQVRGPGRGPVRPEPRGVVGAQLHRLDRTLSEAFLSR